MGIPEMEVFKTSGAYARIVLSDLPPLDRI